MTREMKRIMVTGAAGQIGSELTLALRKKYRSDNVLATDIKTQIDPKLRDSGPFEMSTSLTGKQSSKPSESTRSIRSTTCRPSFRRADEKKPQLAWDVNMNGTFNILEAARETQHGTGLLPELHRRLRPRDPPPQHSPGHHPQAQDHVRRDQGRRRAPLGLLRRSASAWTSAAAAIPASSATRRCPAAERPTTPWPSSSRPSRTEIHMLPRARTRAFP